jgi:hypothetical protein
MGKSGRDKNGFSARVVKKIRRRNQIRHRRSGHCARASHGT